MQNFFSILLQSVQLASKEMGSSAEDRVLRRRKTDRESCLRLKFSIYNARPSKVLTTERLVDRFQGRLRDRERARQRCCFCSKKQTGTTPGRRKSSRQRGLVFFRDNYEIESGQGNDTTSVPRGRQTERQAVESPHDREARRSFSGTITRSRAGKATILLSGRQTERPAVESPHDREARLFQGPLGDRERARQRYCFWSKR